VAEALQALRRATAGQWREFFRRVGPEVAREILAELEAESAASLNCDAQLSLPL
jgi:hypothetical protein